MQTIPESEWSEHIFLWENFGKICQPVAEEFYFFFSSVCVYMCVYV